MRANEFLDESSEDALAYATKAHAGQERSGGDPYISHPVRVANHIKQFKRSHNLDALLSAAYLHDTIEDTDTTQEILHDLFGGLVASLVVELTSDPEQIQKMGKKHYLAHKMATMSSYALVIKLADRLDNVKDITTAKTPEWRAKYKAETQHILDYIEKNRVLSGTHRKLISLIRAKINDIPTQTMAEDLSLPKNKWETLISSADKHEAGDELVNLVQHAYSVTPKGSMVHSLKDVIPSDWNVIDWDKDPDIDACVFYRKNRPGENWVGYKIQGLGHDGTRTSKDKAINKILTLLSKPGVWIESSDAMRHVLQKLNTPSITDEHFLQTLFNDPNLQMIDQNTYQRQLDNGDVIKETVFGNPQLK